MRVALLCVVAALGACGDKIGDPCALSTECSPQGDRICIDPGSNGGYCTIPGCDFDTCPEEAVCIRFFAIAETDRICESETEDLDTDDCTPDEFCTLGGFCVPRTAESRFCMLACSVQDDCRSGFECRDEGLMKAHGGEPVPPPGESVQDNLVGFCAPAPF
jgi:hypothetical protein